MEAYWGLGAIGRSGSNPFPAKSTMNAEYFTAEVPMVDTLARNYDIDASLGGFSGLIKQYSDEYFGPIMESFCNPITAESIGDAENFTPEVSMADPRVPSYQIDASLTEFLGLEENSDVDSGAIGRSFCHPINAESIANAECFNADGPMVDTLVPNYEIDASLTEFLGLKETDLEGLVGGFCNPITTKSTNNAEYFTAENPMFDALNQYDEDDARYREFFGLKGYCNEGSYDAVRPFLPTTTPLALNVDVTNEVFYQENQVGFEPILQQNIYDSNQPEKQVESLQKLHPNGGELQPQLQLDFLQKLHAKEYDNQPKSREEAKEEEEVLIIGEIPAPKKKRHSRKRKCDIIVSDEELRRDSSGWIKYGEKTLIGSTYPKGYYRCGFKHCPARKHVEKISENPDKFAVWFNNDHEHGENPAAKCIAFDEKPFLQPTPEATTPASSNFTNSFYMNHDLIRNEGEDCCRYIKIKIKEEPKDFYEGNYNDTD